MKEVILYGPPAVGKYTIASELSKNTGYKLFHNHLTADLVGCFYELWSDKFWGALHKTRSFLIELAANDNINILFTYVHEPGKKEHMIEKYMQIYEDHGGEVCLVKLTTSRENLLKRVSDKSRIRYNKVTDPQALNQYLDAVDLYASIGGRDSLTVDTSSITPSEAANLIAHHYNLSTLKD